MIEIPLTQGYVTLVDDMDADIADKKWCVKCTPRSPYAIRSISIDGKATRLYVHRVILERIIGRPLADGEFVDHIDGDGLNNTRSNLRLASKQQNNCNRGLDRDNRSGVKGVHWRPTRGKWQARITINQKIKHLGYFVNIDDAAKCYNDAAIALFGEFAWLNPIPVQSKS